MSDQTENTTNRLRDYRRIVIKIGSALLVDEQAGLRAAWLEALADDLHWLSQQQAEVIVVSSGAIALGRIQMSRRGRTGTTLGTHRTLKLEESQAAASIGQIELSRAYSEALSRRGLNAGQILLTLGDTQERQRYLNARSTISTLLSWNCVPVINENDTVATQEICYGDNDRLAARVATMMGADLLVVLSDVDGLYRSPPPAEVDDEFRQTQFIPLVQQVDGKIESMAGESTSGYARGGMKTKIQAAKIATTAGTAMVITSGRKYHPIKALAEGALATWFQPSSNAVPDRKKWIAGQLELRGKLFVDNGAVTALRGGKSLLPAGVTRVEGNFRPGDTVAILNEDQIEVGRGLVSYDSDDAGRVAGLKSDAIVQMLGNASHTALIHRDNLVLHQSAQETDHDGS